MVKTTKWTDFITFPAVLLILGFRGSGKTALSYYLTEKCSSFYDLKKVVFGVPKSATQILPQSYSIVNDLDLPRNSAIIVDEISLFAYARRSMSKTNEVFDRMVANSRKRNQILLLITHHSRKVDLNLVTDIDALIYKKPSKLQIEMDRPAIRRFARRAYEYLKDKDKSHSYVFSFTKDKEIGLKNPLPDFWSEELSDLISVKEVDTKKRPQINEESLEKAGWRVDDLDSRIQNLNDLQKLFLSYG